MRFKFIMRNYIDLILNKCYFLYCLVSAFSYGLFFTYISLSSFYIVGLLNYSIISLGWIVLLNALIIFFASLCVPRYSVRYGLDRVVFWGTGLLFLGGLGMTISLLLWGVTLFSFMCPMAVVTLGVGFIRPTASAGALKEADKRVAGSAASGFNFISFVGGSVCTSVGGWFVEDPLYFAVFVFVLGGIAGALAWLNCREHKKNLQKQS